MEKPAHIYFEYPELKCSTCGSVDNEIKDGKSKHFTIHILRDLKNPGKYDENFLAWAECHVCKRQTQAVRPPFLYY